MICFRAAAASEGDNSDGRSLNGVGGSTREGFLSSARTHEPPLLCSPHHTSSTDRYLSFLREKVAVFKVQSGFLMKQNRWGGFSTKGGKYGE